MNECSFSSLPVPSPHPESAAWLGPRMPDCTEQGWAVPGRPTTCPGCRVLFSSLKNTLTPPMLRRKEKGFPGRPTWLPPAPPPTHNEPPQPPSSCPASPTQRQRPCLCSCQGCPLRLLLPGLGYKLPCGPVKSYVLKVNAPWKNGDFLPTVQQGGEASLLPPLPGTHAMFRASSKLPWEMAGNKPPPTQSISAPGMRLCL